MGETANQIEAHIEHTRDELGSNLHELERKVKSAADWRQHFQSNPMAMMGAAFGGGLLVAMMMGGSRPRHVHTSKPYERETRPNYERESRPNNAIENIKGALIGVAATRVRDLIEEIIPGFQEQYDRATRHAATGD